jgi:hypothetical protein
VNALTTDIAPCYDHITSGIGAVMIGKARFEWSRGEAIDIDGQARERGGRKLWSRWEASDIDGQV